MERTRETLFAILQPSLRGASFLDLFAGTGSVGIEAFSRGASRVAFIDSARNCIAAIRENVEMIGRQDAAVIIGREWAPALHQLGRHSETFDIIFADPPYPDEAILPKVAQSIILGDLLKPGGWLILQHSQRLRLPHMLTAELELSRDRRFGDTVLSFYRHLAPDMKLPNSAGV